MTSEQIIEKLKEQLRDTRFMLLTLWTSEVKVGKAAAERFTEEIDKITKTLEGVIKK
jgi:hypothetical protein